MGINYYKRTMPWKSLVFEKNALEMLTFCDRRITVELFHAGLGVTARSVQVVKVAYFMILLIFTYIKLIILQLWIFKNIRTIQIIYKSVKIGRWLPSRWFSLCDQIYYRGTERVGAYARVRGCFSVINDFFVIFHFDFWILHLNKPIWGHSCYLFMVPLREKN